jgi:SAM-dependent methyltransferase
MQDSPRAAVLALATGYWRSGVVYALARFNVADLLAEAPRDAAWLAARTGLLADPLARLLRAAASLGLLASDAAGAYRLTPLGQVLRSDVAGSVRDNVVSVAGVQREAWRADALEAALMGPGPGGWRHVAGAAWFDWLAGQPDAMATFQRGMRARHAHEPEAVARALDLAGHRTVMDLGGGNGLLLSAVLAAAPHVSGVLLDLPGAIDAASRGEGGPLPRCRLVAHDFFRQLPVCADLILLKRVIHDWDDAAALRILTHARDALEPGGSVIVLDALLQPGDAPDPVKLLDLHMLLLPGGRQRGEAEFRTLLASAGLRLRSVRQLLPDLAALTAEAA